MDAEWEACGFYSLSLSRMEELHDWTQRVFYRRLELSARDWECQILRDERKRASSLAEGGGTSGAQSAPEVTRPEDGHSTGPQGV